MPVLSELNVTRSASRRDALPKTSESPAGSAADWCSPRTQNRHKDRRARLAHAEDALKAESEPDATKMVQLERLRIFMSDVTQCEEAAAATRGLAQEQPAGVRQACEQQTKGRSRKQRVSGIKDSSSKTLEHKLANTTCSPLVDQHSNSSVHIHVNVNQGAKHVNSGTKPAVSRSSDAEGHPVAARMTARGVRMPQQYGPAIILTCGGTDAAQAASTQPSEVLQVCIGLAANSLLESTNRRPPEAGISRGWSRSGWRTRTR